MVEKTDSSDITTPKKATSTDYYPLSSIEIMDSKNISPTATSLSDSGTLNQKWDGFRQRESYTNSYSIPLDSITGKTNERVRTWSIPHRERIRSLDDVDRALHGYPRLATFMAHEPGAAIARRFGSLNLRMLLYKQAEIVCLEHELDELEQTFAGQRHIHHSVRELIHAEPGSVGQQIWEKVQKLDVALERYNRLLLEQKALYELPDADHIDINDLNNFVNNEAMGGSWMQHPEDTIWETVYDKGKYKAEQRDLVRLSGSARYIDPFTRWLWGPFLQFFHRIYSRLRRSDRDDGSYSYDSAGLNAFARTISMAMASLLPTVSILALYFINNDLWRMAFILIFSVVFTACLSIFTAATRIEIFIASLGLASVQAVFVGNLIGPSVLSSGSNSAPKG